MLASDWFHISFFEKVNKLKKLKLGMYIRSGKSIETNPASFENDFILTIIFDKGKLSNLKVATKYYTCKDNRNI